MLQHTHDLGLAGGGGSECVQGAQPRGPLPQRSGRQGRPHADPCPSPLSFRFWGAPCVLGTSPGCAPLTGCRALPLRLSQEAGDGSFQPLPGPSPHFPRGFVGPELPRKAGRVSSTIVTGSRHPTFTDEERKLRRARPWPWWAGHPGNSVCPTRGWMLKDGGKTGTRSTGPHRPRESHQEERGAPEALGQGWRGGGGAGAQTGRGGAAEPRVQGRSSLQGRGLAR